VPTKCRGKAWHPEMVNRIINLQGVEPLQTHQKSCSLSPTPQVRKITNGRNI
jgi:hypothetical protein